MKHETVVKMMLRAIGEQENREGLRDTPHRVATMWKEIFRGYDTTQLPTLTVFPNGKDGIAYDQMILDSGTFFSFCEHHMMPFFGTYHFAYIPNGYIMGLSKVQRIVNFFSAKLQIQERLVKEIVDLIESKVEPKGIGVILKGRHLCKEMRGVKSVGGEMITSDLRGVLRDDRSARAEFLSLINR